MRLTRLLLSTEFKYFKRYVEREMYKDWRRLQWEPITGWKEVTKRNWHYSEHRPWTEDFKRDNGPFAKHRHVYVEPIKEWKLFKGDRVEILIGKDKGKQGIINCIIKERNWCFVEALNCDFNSVQQNPIYPPMCSKDERPLLVTTQVKLVDPSDEEPTDVEWRYTEAGEHVRVSTRTGRIIPLPTQAKELEDFVLPSAYIETSKDTKDAEIKEVTFEPKAKTFDQEIMESLNITENRQRGKTYWY